MGNDGTVQLLHCTDEETEAEIGTMAQVSQDRNRHGLPPLQGLSPPADSHPLSSCAIEQGKWEGSRGTSAELGRPFPPIPWNLTWDLVESDWQENSLPTPKD